MPAWAVGPYAVAVGVDDARRPRWWRTVDTDRAHDLVVDVEPATLPGELNPAEPVRVRRAGSTLTIDRGAGFVVDVDLAGRPQRARFRGQVDLAGGDEPCPMFETFVRLWTSCKLLDDGGALLHGASILVDDEQGRRGYAFLGVSGAGKSTLVSQAPDGVYLTDDQTIVAPRRRSSSSSLSVGSFDVWGSPFAGVANRRSGPVHAPLRAVVLLESARPSSTSLVRLGAAQATERVLRHVCAYEKTAAEAARGLAFAAALASAQPVFALERHLDSSLLDVVRRIDEAVSSASAREAA